MQSTEARSSPPTGRHRYDPLQHVGQDESRSGIVVSPCSDLELHMSNGIRIPSHAAICLSMIVGVTETLRGHMMHH